MRSTVMGDAQQRARQDVYYNVCDIPQPFQQAYEGTPEVGVAVKVISISHLDMADNTYLGDFNVNIAWKGDKEKDKPVISIYNTTEELEGEGGVVKPGEAGFDHYYRLRFKGTFRQTYDLHTFPFDSQKLTLRVRLKSECNLIHLPWGPPGEDGICPAATCDTDAISADFLLKHAEVDNKYSASYKFGKLTGYDPEATFAFHVDRKPGCWVTKYGQLMSCVCSFSLTAFALDATAVNDRLSLGFTLNLTVVATFYLMQDKLPSVSYFTLLEKHLTFCIFFTMLVMAFNVLPSVFGNEVVTWLETPIFFALLTLWCGYHVYAHIRMTGIHHERHRVPGRLMF